MQLDYDDVNDLFQVLEPGDVLDITTQRLTNETRILIHFRSPDWDGTHMALSCNIDTGQWELFDYDAGAEVAYRA